MNQHDEQAQSTLNVFLLAKLRLPQDMVDKTQDILPHAYYVTTNLVAGWRMQLKNALNVPGTNREAEATRWRQVLHSGLAEPDSRRWERLLAAVYNSMTILNEKSEAIFAVELLHKLYIIHAQNGSTIESERENRHRYHGLQ